jgi:PAS domain-containing protein
MALGFFKNSTKNSESLGVLEKEMTKSRNDMMSAALRTGYAASELTQKLRSQLQDANRQFDIAASIITDALIVCDIDGKIKSINSSGMLLLPSATVGNNLYDALSGVKRATMWSDIELGFAMTKDNLSLSGSIAKMFKSNGREIVVVLLRNIQDNYENVFNAEVYGLMVVQNDNIVAANKAVAGIFGFDDQQHLIGEEIQKYITYKNIQDIEMAQCSAIVHHSDGQIYNIEISLTPITWNNDKAVLLTVETTTEHHHKNFLSFLGKKYTMSSWVEQNAMLCHLDSDFIVLECNDVFAKLYHTTPEEMKNVSLFNFMTNSEKEITEIHLKSLNQTHRVRIMRVEFLGDDNSTHLQEWRDIVELDDNGVVTGYERMGRIAN